MFGDQYEFDDGNESNSSSNNGYGDGGIVSAPVSGPRRLPAAGIMDISMIVISLSLFVIALLIYKVEYINNLFVSVLSPVTEKIQLSLFFSKRKEKFEKSLSSEQK